MIDEKTKLTQTKLSRRNFLLAAGAGGVASAATAAVLVSGKALPLSQQTAAARADEAASAVADSAHARNYYRTARI